MPSLSTSSKPRCATRFKLYRGGIPIPTIYRGVKQRLYNIKMVLEEEKSHNNAFHTRAPIPPRQNTYILPQRQSNYHPPNPTPTVAHTYGGQGQPMDLSRTRNQVTCWHCGKLGYLMSHNCKADCQHCGQKHPGRWCDTQPPPKWPYNSCTLECIDFTNMSEEEKEQLKKAVGF